MNTSFYNAHHEFLLHASMKIMYTRQGGFALLEVLMVTSIVGMMAAVTIPTYRNYQIRNDLSLATEQVSQGLARARLLAQSASEDDGWGFYAPAGTIYKGTSFAARDENFDEVYPMPSTITWGGISEITYGKVNARPSETGSIILTALNNDQTTVLVEVETERITLENSDTFVICHRPPGNPNNAHSIEVSESAWPNHRDSHGDTVGPCANESSSSSSAASSVASSAASSVAPGSCQNRFTVAADGTITTTGPLTVTYEALGSAITYGAGGPEIEVTAKRKKTSGSGWNNLFDGDEIDGGETDSVAYGNGQQVVVQVRGYYKKKGWLTFDETYATNDQSGHALLLRDGDPVPDYPAFDDQEDLESFMQDVIDGTGHIDIGPYELIVITELGVLDSQASDFQDAVILLSFGQPSC